MTSGFLILPCSNVDENLISLGESVSDGKSSIASAITSNGVATESDATFDKIVENISTLSVNRYNAGKSASKTVTLSIAAIFRTNDNHIGITINGVSTGNIYNAKDSWQYRSISITV